MPVRAEARDLAAGDLHVGREDVFEREVTEADIAAFAAVSGDANPLHVDAAYAATTNYGRPIAHGAFQVGLASAMLGMLLPGRRVLLMSVASARFPNPLYYPTRVAVRGTVTAWDAGSQKGMLKVVVEDRGASRATAEIFMSFTLHDRRDAAEGADAAPRAAAASDVAATADDASASRPVVLVTGAAGGLGARLVEALAGEYAVLAQTFRRPLPGALAAAGAREVRFDVTAPGWETELDAGLGGRPLFAVVHVAWPGAPQGGLLAVDDDAIERQLLFGGVHTVRLARFLAARVPADGGRLVAISSTYAEAKPNVSLGAYSLGKATLEHTMRLLAPELARRQVTANTIAPAVVAEGMNAHLNERQRLRESAQIPLGRLCESGDVVAATRYLLSAGAAFVSGQSLRLTGAQL